MPEYTYKAMDAKGAKTRGSVVAATSAHALDDLTAKGLFVTQVDEIKGGAGAASGGFSIPFMPIVSAAELVLVIRRLSTLVGSGIPLVECLKAISEQVDSPAFHHVLSKVHEDVSHGQNFSKALSKHPKVFPQMMTSMVRVGETGGILPTVLEQLADFTERDREIRGEVKGAMAYPILVLFLAVGTIIFLMTTAVPKLAVMFSGMNATLPLPTVILLGVSTFLDKNGIYCLGALILAVIGFIQWIRTEQGAAIFDHFKLRIPVFGVLMRRAAIARFSRSLGALLSGGVPLMEALDVVKRVIGSDTMSNAVERMKEHVRKGNGMARGLREEDLFPDMVSYMVSAGEDSGHLDDMLFKIADVYEMETRNAVKMMLGLLAPLLILFVAGVVGFIAMAMLMPIFQLNQMVG